MSELTRTTPDRTTAAIASMSAVALLLSAVSLVLTVTDDDLDAQQVEDRLACLELPGPNDCGADGR
jgi:uncharacterized membrane protein